MKSRQDTLWKMLLVKNKEISIIKRICIKILCIFSLFLVCQMIDNMSIIPSSSTVCFKDIILFIFERKKKFDHKNKNKKFDSLLFVNNID